MTLIIRHGFCVSTLCLIEAKQPLSLFPWSLEDDAEIFEDAGHVERCVAKLMDLTKRQMGPDTQQHSLRKYGPSHHFYCFNAF